MHEFSTRPTEEMRLHEERAMRLMYELRAMPSPTARIYVGPPYGWVTVGNTAYWSLPQ